MTATIQCQSCSGAAHGFWSCLLREQRARLAQAATPHVYRAHESIFHEGTPALAVYCVQSGSIKLFKRLNDGEEIVVGVRGSGDLVGLRGTLAGLPYASTATTLERAVVCAIRGETFLELVRQNVTLAYRLLSRLALESRRMEERFVERQHAHVKKRTARFLAQQLRGSAPDLVPASSASAGGRIPISMSREDIAQLIGTTPETLSRTLHSLADDGLLQLDRKGIRVLDLPALLKLAQ